MLDRRHVRLSIVVVSALVVMAATSGCTKRGMTWNVNGECAINEYRQTDCNEPYRSRATALNDWAYVLRTVGPDVAALQEVCNGPGRWDVQELENGVHKSIAYYYTFATTHRDGSHYRDCGNAIMSTVAPQDPRCWYISYAAPRGCAGVVTHMPSSSAGVKAPGVPDGCPESDCRSVLATTLNFSDGTTTWPVRVFNTHVSLAGSVTNGQGMAGQIQAVANIAKDSSSLLRKVIMGDFQRPDSSEAIFEPLRRAGFRPVEISSTQPATGRDGAKHDYIWVSCPAANFASGISTWAVGGNASDHYPFWADFSSACN